VLKKRGGSPSPLTPPTLASYHIILGIQRFLHKSGTVQWFRVDVFQEGYCNSSKVRVSHQGAQPLPRSRVVLHTINMELMFHHLMPTPHANTW
jgi:hypothetical protein